MNGVPGGNEIVRAFIPANNFDDSKRFYEALGFEKIFDSEVAIFKLGGSQFILAPSPPGEGAQNLMMQLMVDDLDAWWAHIDSLDLARRFGVSPPSAPVMQPWGLNIAYLVDPAGVLWHVAQRRRGVRHD